MEARNQVFQMSASSDVEREELMLKSDSNECDFDEISVNSLDMLKAVMEPSGSENESSESSRSTRREEEASSIRKRKQSRGERDRKYHNRSWSAEHRCQSNSPVMDPRRRRFTPNGNGRIARYRNRPRNVSPPYNRLRRRLHSRSRSPPVRRRRVDPRSRSPASSRNFRSRHRRTVSHSRSPPPCGSIIRDKSFSSNFGKVEDTNQDLLDSPLISSGLKSVVVVPKPPVHCDDHTVKSDEESNAGDGSNQGVRKCRDFEEKGLCLRGELCPYDHGKDPIVVGDILQNAPAGPPMPGVGRGFIPRPRLPAPPVTGSNAVMCDEYFPENPGLEPNLGWHPPPFRPRQFGFGFMARGRGGLLFRPTNLPPYPNSHAQRHLISVQPSSGTPGHFRSPHPTTAVSNGIPVGRPGLQSNRNRMNDCLEVRKIPKDQNNILQLNSHFSQFGKIGNIQINYEGDPEAALVTFVSPADAQKAYRSSEAVLNNRFIKVFWHNTVDVHINNEANKNMNVLNPSTNTSRLPVRYRIGYHQQPRMFASYPAAAVRPNHPFTGQHQNDKFQGPAPQRCINPNSHAEAHVSLSTSTVKQNAEMSAMKLNSDDQRRQETLRLAKEDFRRRLQTMMDEQICTQKKLIANLESGKLTPEEREKTLKLLKSLQDSVPKLAKELNSTNLSIPQSHDQEQVESEPKLKTQEEIQKEILDTELDLIKEEQNGKDPSDLRQKLFEVSSQYLEDSDAHEAHSSTGEDESDESDEVDRNRSWRR